MPTKVLCRLAAWPLGGDFLGSRWAAVDLGVGIWIWLAWHMIIKVEPRKHKEALEGGYAIR